MTRTINLIFRSFVRSSNYTVVNLCHFRLVASSFRPDRTILVLRLCFLSTVQTNPVSRWYIDINSIFTVEYHTKETMAISFGPMYKTTKNRKSAIAIELCLDRFLCIFMYFYVFLCNIYFCHQ